ncbi:hypothetical protein [Blastococcus sp. SYSU D01042]
MSTEDVLLYRTASGGRLHIRNCPHLMGSEVMAAADTDGEICNWCDKEIRGEGRECFVDLDAALRAFGGPQGNWPLIREHLAGVHPDEVWIPFSRSYIALGLKGRAVAWVGKTYVQPPEGDYIELPGFRPGSGGGVAAEDTWGDMCEVHNVSRSRSGACGMCFD